MKISNDNQNETVASDNVVGRLYSIIKMIQKHQGGNTETALIEVFSLNENDVASIYSSYAKLFTMILDGKHQIEMYSPKNKDKHLKTLDNVISGLIKIKFNAPRNPINNGLDDFKNHFNANLMLSLEYCADYLSDFSKEIRLEETELKSLSDEINNMISELMDSEINNELKIVITYHFKKIRDSFLNYSLFGTEGIKNEVSTAVGSLLLNGNAITNARDKNIFGKAFEILTKVNTMINIGNKGTKLLEPVLMKMLE